MRVRSRLMSWGWCHWGDLGQISFSEGPCLSQDHSHLFHSPRHSTNHPRRKCPPYPWGTKRRALGSRSRCQQREGWESPAGALDPVPWEAPGPWESAQHCICASCGAQSRTPLLPSTAPPQGHLWVCGEEEFPLPVLMWISEVVPSAILSTFRNLTVGELVFPLQSLPCTAVQQTLGWQRGGEQGRRLQEEPGGGDPAVHQPRNLEA